MKAEEFLQHLHRKLWIYIIKHKEFNSYYENDTDGNYYAEDFYAENIPALLSSLKEDFPFYETYQEVIGSVNNSEERNLVVDFMTWFKLNENLKGQSYYAAFMMNDLQIQPLINLTKFTENKKLDDIPQRINHNEEKINTVLLILEKFTSATKSITERRSGKTSLTLEDEYDIQDILHLILKPFFPMIRLEEVVAGIDSERFLKIDFIINPIKLGIECKYIRNAAHSKSITKEINDDIQTYHQNQDCDDLIFFIYDKQLLIKNPDILELQYTNKQTFNNKVLNVKLLVRPKN